MNLSQNQQHIEDQNFDVDKLFRQNSKEYFE